MRLDGHSEIAGRPVREMRDFLYRTMDWTWTPGHLADKLRLPASVASATVERLVEEGLITRADDELRDGEEYFRVTTAGRAVALASLGPPLRRRTCERKLAEFLERVGKINRDPYYLYRVERVILFGSMLSDAERIADIDLALALQPRETDRDKQRSQEEQRIQEAFEAGRRFSNIVQMLSWPRDEVLLYLRSRSRALSFHDMDDGVLETCEQRVIYEAT